MKFDALYDIKELKIFGKVQENFGEIIRKMFVETFIESETF